MVMPSTEIGKAGQRIVACRMKRIEGGNLGNPKSKKELSRKEATEDSKKGNQRGRMKRTDCLGSWGDCVLSTGAGGRVHTAC